MAVGLVFLDASSHLDIAKTLSVRNALYVKNSLNHSASPSIDELDFDCSAWSIIKLSGNKALLVGVIYRSPSYTAENNQNLSTLLRTAATANCQYLTLICLLSIGVPTAAWSPKVLTPPTVWE